MSGWIGVDLDGTLAVYESKQGIATIGAPIARMVERVKRWLAEGRDVRIITARVADDYMSWASALDKEDAKKQREMIARWCIRWLGCQLEVTAVKDYEMVELWDDRAVTVEKNTGRVLTAGHPEAAP